MRPTYETDEHKSTERKVAEFIAEVYGRELLELPKYYAADYALLKDGNLKSLMEIKCRSIESDKYLTALCPLDKWVKLMQFSAAGIKTLFVVSYTDKIKYVPVEQIYNIKVSGRKDRGDKLDMGLHVHVPVNKMVDL